MNNLLLPRLALCVLSVVLLAVLGLLGDELQSIARLPLPIRCGTPGAAPDLPTPTRLVLDFYGRGSGNFLLSLTPFMIVFAGIAVRACIGRHGGEDFCYGFMAAWLLAAIYAGLYAWALILPYQSLCADLDTRPVVNVVVAIDALVLLAVIVLIARRRRSPATAAESSEERPR